MVFNAREERIDFGGQGREEIRLCGLEGGFGEKFEMLGGRQLPVLFLHSFVNRRGVKRAQEKLVGVLEKCVRVLFAALLLAVGNH